MIDQDFSNRDNLKPYVDKIEKPCHDVGYCPYGYLVEYFQIAKKEDEYSCKVFGHDCPAFYLVEGASEDNENQTYETLADRIEGFIDIQNPTFGDTVAALELVRLRTYISMMSEED